MEAIPESSTYKGWRVRLWRYQNKYCASAVKVGWDPFGTGEFSGKGSKSRAFSSIKQQIDEKEDADG